MFDIGWTELLVIGVVALIVIGPKDLPVMFQQLGRFTGKLRAMSREFQGAMEQAARDSGVQDVHKDLKSAASMATAAASPVSAMKQAADRFEKWDPLKGVKAGLTPDPDAPLPGTAPRPSVAPAPAMAPEASAKAEALPTPETNEKAPEA